PNRIGQGIEFDTCCVHASFALREAGFETIMVNCNPETVSTDYDTSDRLYFEPLTLEDVLEIVDLEKPEGVIVQFGGQTPLKLAKGLADAGVPMWGTSVDAIEIAVDAISDGTDVVIAGVMEHIEEAGIHSGDSTTVVPPYIIGHRDQDKIRRRTVELAKALSVVGLMNVQYAIKDGELYVLEVNPRASRTVPYVSKATGVPFAKIAALVMAGQSLRSLGLTVEPRVDGYFVKAPVFPFNRFPREDTVLGPEMKSTGEVMGSSHSFGEAYAKALLGAGTNLPLRGTAFISVNDNDKRPVVVTLAKDLTTLGFKIAATSGT